jgi:predicted RNA-binding protein associated with RNAse of E/G family
MPDTITEIKRNIGKPDQTFSCRLLRHGGDRIVISYRSTRPYRAAGLHLPAGTLTLAYYQEQLPYILWKMLGPDEHLIGYYVHLCDDVRITGETVAYRDMMLDIWFFPDGSHRLLDEDELRSARTAGLVDEATVARIFQTAGDLIRRFPVVREGFDALVADLQNFP